MTELPEIPPTSGSSAFRILNSRPETRNLRLFTLGKSHKVDFDERSSR